ncbi:MAG: alkaline phosphatase family protein [Hydrogenophilaceae bacterium]|jgi:alkaline phosphatase D|nr:alkaline phosphatase family protein [Hydrogenophilaceae bacterium]
MRVLIVTLAFLGLAACSSQPATEARAPAPPAIDIVAPPGAGAGVALPSGALTTIMFGSCHTAERPIPILRTIAQARPDLFVYLGDNVYGDTHGDMSLPELRAQYALLAAHPDFQALRTSVPMIATWDDHDFGLNDAGGEFEAKALAKTLFEEFWGTGARTGSRDGVYDSYVFGPEGRRVQIILLDTRYGRTPLTRLPQPSDRGRYARSTDPAQRMLSEAQWAWLAEELRRPAEIRIIASSIQVLADGHDWEAWETLPLEQARLYETIRTSGARGVVFVSGDRHVAGLYAEDGRLSHRAYELTASSLNLSFRETSDERSSNQLGDLYAPVNFGTMRIDWAGRRLTLEVNDLEGRAVREQAIAFADLGL